MNTHCAHLPADLFLYVYEVELIKNLLKDKKNKQLAILFDFTFWYIDDVLWLNNPYFSQYLQLI